MKKVNIKCPYCNSPAVLRPASAVFGRNVKSKGSYLYVCSHWPKCDAYVSAHKNNLRPMGTLANGELRHKRIIAHRALEAYRTKTRMSKWGIYLWMQGKLRLDARHTHIAMFTEEQCDQLIKECNKALRKLSEESGEHQ